jgi:hypothetical protein
MHFIFMKTIPLCYINFITIISRKTQQCHKWLYLDLGAHNYIFYVASCFVLISYWPDDGYDKPKHVVINLDIVIYDIVVFYDWLL